VGYRELLIEDHRGRVLVRSDGLVESSSCITRLLPLADHVFRALQENQAVR
jgi:hypothetical protein